MTKPSGRVIGVDIIPAQPPRGVSTIQGNFLSPDVQASLRSFLRDPNRGRTSRPQVYTESDMASGHAGDVAVDAGVTRAYIDQERHQSRSRGTDEEGIQDAERTVDVVLSDMCEPWEQTGGFFNRTLSDPYLRMMNTSGNNFRDHAGSMVSFLCLCWHSSGFESFKVCVLILPQDLGRSALHFSFDTLKVGGSFVCKFYQGAEDKALEKSLKALFHKVHREKPESSRSVGCNIHQAGVGG